ncbi:MAG: YicC/YloC family endoribonuclease [Rhodospirillales bacterium]|nr:YicC/YloC family endoribonuclease [Rhodospirillales bacterium]
MVISSMTGFARAQGQNDRCAWTWEVKSVNGRGLDVRSRLPNGFERLDPPIRERVAARFRRGNFALSLSMQWNVRGAGFRINQTALDEVIGLLAEIQRRIPNAAPPRPEGVLALRGVVEAVEEEVDEETQQAADAEILAALDTALESLQAARRDEGRRLSEIVSGQFDEIETLCRGAETVIASQPKAIRERLLNQVKALLDELPALSEERIAQEAALLMTKADPREELDRLKAHLAAGRALLGESEAVGRRLDFLCQEFNRETNTLCSKSSDMELSRCGLALKAVIDQMREQVQNIE